MPAKPKKILLQTHVNPLVARQFDALAKMMGQKRAGYLRYIVDQVVEGLKIKKKQDRA